MFEFYKTHENASKWMSNNISTLGNKTMRNICMPGSHDSGMSVYDSGTAFAKSCNTLTQMLPVFGQLNAGVRYFDIRPVIHGGKFYTGHYSHIDQIKSWQGANGQSIENIINDVNNFTKDNPELIILNLSHDLDTDLGNDSYAPFTQDQWNRLFTQLQGIQNLKAVSAGDLSLLKLNEFIGDNKAAVIVVVQPSGTCGLGDFSHKGFYTYSQYNVYNSYANTESVVKMMDDQFGKMHNQRKSKDDSLFLMAWTLTQSSQHAVLCSGDMFSILTLAREPNSAIINMMIKPEIGFSKDCFPNVFSIDGVPPDTMLADFAMILNNL